METKTYKERIENGEIKCACDNSGKCGKHYMKSDQYPLDKEDLEIYLDMCRKQRIKYFQSPETLKEIDKMVVKALDLFHNGVQNDTPRT